MASLNATRVVRFLGLSELTADGDAASFLSACCTHTPATFSVSALATTPYRNCPDAAVILVRDDTVQACWLRSASSRRTRCRRT